MNEKAKVDRFVENAKAWKLEIAELRKILLNTKLTEEFKWNLPCYSYQEANVVIIQPFKSCLGLMFFNGKFLKDSKKILVNNGPNSRSAMRLEFVNVSEVRKRAATIKNYVNEATKLKPNENKAKLKIEKFVYPEELSEKFKKDPKVKKKFESLTPGRQRAYIIYISGAKQSTTRKARVAKCTPLILNGKGLND